MGQVVGAYGVKGWVKIRPFTEEVGALLEHPAWQVATQREPGQWRRVRPIEGHEHGNTLVAQLEGVADRDQAARLKGARIALSRSELPAPREGEFYWDDLIGLAVVNLDGILLGEVRGVLDAGAHAVLRVEAERERLIPFVAAIVDDVDMAGRTIRADWQPDY